jgi:hypothetical protein
MCLSLLDLLAGVAIAFCVGIVVGAVIESRLRDEDDAQDKAPSNHQSGDPSS